MLKFFSTYRLQFLVIMTFIGLILLMSHTHSKSGSSQLQSIVQTFTYPLQASASSIASTFKNFWNSYISLVEVTDDYTVKVKLMGACETCHVSMMTLKNGVEVAVKNAVPKVKKVIEISSQN